MLLGTLICLSAAGLATAQTLRQTSLFGALSSNGLSSFQAYINQFPSLQNRLRNANVTVLAPSNAAIEAYMKSSEAVGNFSIELQTLLQYHVLPGHYTRAQFKQLPLYLPTLANDTTPFVNVTGGQQVEVSSSGHQIRLQSGLKRNSTIVTPDIIFEGSSTSNPVAGVVHIIDRVLLLPEDQITTGQRTGLSNFVNLVTSLPSDPRYQGFHDGTIFAPNGSVPIWSNYTSEALSDFKAYHLVKGIFHSTELVDSKALPSRLGKEITITVQDGDTYANNAKIIATDYLISMGVMHVLDRQLDPEHIDARPPPPGWETSLSTGAYIGIGVAISLVLIAIAALVWHFYFRRKRAKEDNLYPFESAELHNCSRKFSEMPNNAKQFAEMPNNSKQHHELENRQLSKDQKDKAKFDARDEIYELG